MIPHMPTDKVRSSVMVLTVWVEGTNPNDLRVRFAAANTAGVTEDRESFAACGIDGICARLRLWLEAFADDDSPRTTLKPGGAALP
jgi:hypothetical protein